MHDPDQPLRCPECGCPIAAGAGPLLCPACALTGGSAADDDEPAAAPAGPRVGSYTLLGEIARGGMGVVYRARQDGLNRIVAVKVLPGAAFAAAGFRARFQREAETAARLNHPGIVTIHEIGEALGQPFLAMDFIDGPSLAERLAEGRMTPEFGAHLVREVARAVAHAHQQGVAHRDLKPSNILLTADQQPVLTDFGLARFLDPDANAGLSLDLMGTPPYLPPERVSDAAGANPVAEDVYGLGAVLYHCLTGRPPFVADSLSGLIAAVSHGEPVPPRRLNHSVPADLETICLKCLETSPAARYAGAAGVADELDRFLRGDPIIARPLGPAGHLVRMIRRKPAVAALVLALLVAVGAGTVVSLMGWRRATLNAYDALALAEWRRVDLYSGTMASATAALEAGNPGQLRILLDECVPTPGESDLRGPEWFLLERLARPRELFTTPAHGHILTTMAWQPAGPALLTAAHDGSLRRWTLVAGGSLQLEEELLPAGGPRVHQLRWLPDNRTFLAAEGTMIRCRRVGEREPLWEVPGAQFSLTGDARLLAVSTGQPFYYQPAGTVALWAMAADFSQRPTRVRQFPQPARAVAISPDARWLALGLTHREHEDDESGLAVLDLQAPEAAPRTLATAAGVWSLAFSPDSARLAVTTLSAAGRVLCFEPVTGRELPLAGDHAARVWAAAFTADSRHLLTTSTDRSLRAWPLAGGPPQVLPLAHANEIWAAALHPAGKLVATGDKDGCLKLHPWPLPGDPVQGFPRHPHFRYARPCATADGTRWIVLEPGAKWRSVVWHPATGAREPLATPVHPIGKLPDGTLVWLDPAAGALCRQTPNQPAVVVALPAESKPASTDLPQTGVSADLSHAFQFAATGHAATVDLSTGVIRQIAGFCRADPLAAALSPGGRFLAAATWRELIIHDFTTGKTTRLSNDPHWAKAIVFTPDGTQLITGGVDGHILLRRLPDLALAGDLRGHLAEVSGLAMSPDGRTLVSSEIGSGLRFWRLDTLHEVMRLPLSAACEIMVFAPDGQSLAVTTCPPASPPTKGELLVIPCPRQAGR
jgi:WD40 repeat protein/predicted Ser/Thr protein kinase